MNKLLNFINSERIRYQTDEDNRFAFSLYKVTRYWFFLTIIYSRYQLLLEQWHANRKALSDYHSSATTESLEKDMIGLSTGGRINLKVSALFNQSNQIETEVQLEIESFYLFAKTLLDKLVNAVWVYFGRVNKKSCTLRSLDDFVNHFEEYAELKKIVVKDVELMKISNELRKEISDFRDWQISHERNPERGEFSSRMTILDEKGYLKMRIKRFFSKDNTEEIFSGEMPVLLKKIETFSEKIVFLVNSNNKLSSYKRKV